MAREKEEITAETKQKYRRPDLQRQVRGREGPMGCEKAAAGVPSWVQRKYSMIADGQDTEQNEVCIEDLHVQFSYELAKCTAP